MSSTSKERAPKGAEEWSRIWSALSTVERNRLFIEAGGMVARNFMLVSAALAAAGGAGWWMGELSLK